jgi:hypothetical protein
MGGLRRPSNGSGPLAELGRALDDLHLHAGAPSTRSIARDTGLLISHDTVHRVLAAARVPTWRALRLVVEALGGDVETFHPLWVAARRGETGS